MTDMLDIPIFLRRPKPHEEPMRSPETPSEHPAQTEPPAPSTPVETPEALEHDAARLHREIEIIEGQIKGKYADKATKKKELDGVMRKLVTIRIKGMK